MTKIISILGLPYLIQTMHLYQDMVVPVHGWQILWLRILRLQPLSWHHQNHLMVDCISKALHSFNVDLLITFIAWYTWHTKKKVCIIRQVLTPNWFSSTFSDNWSEPLPLTWAKRGKTHQNTRSVICTTWSSCNHHASWLVWPTANRKLETPEIKNQGKFCCFISSFMPFFTHFRPWIKFQVAEMAKDGVFDCPPRRTVRAKEGCRPPVSSGSSRTTSSGSVSALGDWSLERACVIPKAGEWRVTRPRDTSINMFNK